jgi:phage tail-like protein
VADNEDPFRTQSFYIELSGVFKGPIIKVTGLSYEREVKTKQQAKAGGMTVINAVPGRYKPATITVHKLVSSDKGFWDWRKQALTDRSLKKVRRHGTVEVIGDGGVTLKWEIINAWPSRIKGPTLDVASDKAVEEIEICYEQLKLMP